MSEASKDRWRAPGLALVLGASAVIVLAAPSVSAQPSIAVTFAQGRLSLSARDVSVAAVIGELRRATGIPILLETGLEVPLDRERSTLDVTDVSLEDGLRRLLAGRHLVVLYSSDGVAEVRVYTAGGAGGALAEEPRAPRSAHELRVAKRNNPRPTHGPTEADMAAKATRMAAARERHEERQPAGPDVSAADGAAAVAEAARALAGEADRTAQVQALETMLDASSAPLEPVLRFAETTQDPELRGQALEVLAAHGARDARVLDLLRALAAGDPDEDVRDQARTLLRDSPE